MIIGIGMDILDIGRVARAVKKESFKQKCYTEGELAYMSMHKDATYAGIFCAKEALAKALGTGFGNIELKDIEVFHDEYGKPEIILHSLARKKAEELSIKRIHLSISHTKEYATAMVVVEGQE